MSKFWSSVFIVAALGVLAGFQNCGGQPTGSSEVSGNQPASSVSMTATVTMVQTECSQYLICSHDNTTNQDSCFLPINMDSTLLNAGNVVSVSGTIRTDMMNICMAQTLQVSQAKLVSGTTVPPTSAQ